MDLVFCDLFFIDFLLRMLNLDVFESVFVLCFVLLLEFGKVLSFVLMVIFSSFMDGLFFFVLCIFVSV